jgi:glycosyltransferase involved in cell wall biosynthesis
MIIALESSTIGPKITGTNRFLVCLIEQLKFLNNNILYFDSNLLPKKYKYLPDSIKRHSYRQSNLKKDIEDSDADFGLFPDYFMPRNFIKPAAVVIHDLSFISHPQFYSKRFVQYYSFMLRHTLKQNPVIITVSLHTKNNIIKYLGTKEENIHLVQGYSNMQNYKSVYNPPSGKDAPYFLYVGHIEPRKNLVFLVQGFRQWQKSVGINIKLKIVGELWIKSRELIELILDCRDDPSVEFTGYVSEEELEIIYSNASGFIHTSLEEGFGFPVLEAMKFNLPIICSKGIATEEISSPLSIPIYPDDITGYQNGLYKMISLAFNNVRPDYEIKYSPSLMRQQLAAVLEKLDSGITKKYAVGIHLSNSIEEALEKTLVYSGMFNSGIKEDKIHEQLFDRKINKVDLDRIIENYKMANIITAFNGSLYLNNRRKGFYQKSDAPLDKYKLINLLEFLNKIPFISLIAFSGGTAIYGLKNHDDIDLFIITKPYALYLVYFIIHLYSLLFNSRKKLCANFLIDETNLEINNMHDFYTAHQIITLNAFRNERMLNYFIARNSWINNYFPNFRIINENCKKSGRGFIFLKPVNWTLMSLYKFIYRKKLADLGPTGSMVLKKNFLKLHSNDNRFKISNEFQKSWNDYRSNKKEYSKNKKHLVLR